MYTPDVEGFLGHYLLSDKEKARKRKAQEYHFIPLNQKYFEDQLEIVKGFFTFPTWDDKTIKRPTFIDVGSGIGTKVVCASAYSFNAYGIEITPAYVKFARQFAKDSDARRATTFIQGDALKHDYSPYDVIYFYCPFMDHKVQIKLEEHIVATAKPGAFFLANLRKHHTLWEGSTVKHVWNGKIFQKS